MPDELLDAELLELELLEVPSLPESLIESEQTLELLEVEGDAQALVESVTTQEILHDLAEPEQELLEIGQQGPPGRDGVGSTTLNHPAAVPMSGHRVVLLDVTGALAYADAFTPSHAYRVLGVTLNAAIPGQNVIVQWFGEISEPSWVWDPLLPVWLGADGVLTQTPPSTIGAAFALIVGFASTPTKLQVDLQPPILLEA